MQPRECGGGKKGLCMSKKEFLLKYHEDFSMKLFEKVKITKPTKKRTIIANSHHKISLLNVIDYI